MKIRENFTSSHVIAFITTFVLISLCYRFWFALQMHQKTPLLFPFYPLFIYAMLGLFLDLALGIFLGSLIYSLQLMIKKFFKNNLPSIFLLHLFGMMILLMIAVIYTANRKLFEALNISLSYTLLTYSAHYQGLSSVYDSYLNSWDAFFLFFTVGIYLLLACIRKSSAKKIKEYLLLIASSLLLISVIKLAFFTSILFENSRFYILSTNPTITLISEMWRYYQNPYVHRTEQPDKKQMQSLTLIDSSFISSQKLKPILQVSDNRIVPTNVVMIILESVGSEYIFDTSKGNRTPMPFLESLAGKSIWFSNNYTNGNTSLSGNFGILSGLYSNPTPFNFEMQPNIYIKSISNWLGQNYHTLFFNSYDTNYFFPKSFVQNSFEKVSDVRSLHVNKKDLVNDIAFDEPAGLNHFLFQLDHLSQPFLAVYKTGPAHSPYYDFGPQFRIFSDISNNLYNRYMNNLNLLDYQLKQIFEFMDKKKLLENTLFIVVSDHGEGFGQHPGSWMHGSSLYQEQVKVPVLFYMPKLFKPAVIKQLTCNVDIVPTVLDALKIPFDFTKIQGQSLLRESFARKYVFISGLENELASIDEMHHKMIIDFSNGKCNTFNLQEDPQELNPHPCQMKSQEEALIKFRNFQPQMLEHYNDSLSGSSSFASAS